MSWIEGSEEKRLYEWVCKNQKAFLFPERLPSADTYYCLFDNSSNVCDYGFASIPELLGQLDKLWKDEPFFDDIKKVCAVAAFKWQPEVKLEKKDSEDSEDSMKIPDFVYMF